MYGLGLARAKHLEAAQDVLEKIATSDEADKFPRAMFELGQICMVKKSRMAARAWFERYLKTMKDQDRLGDPGVKVAREALRALEEEN